MMTGYEVFCLYQAIKLHFTSQTYDFFRYNGKTHVSLTSFENRKDKYHFHKLARKHTNRDDLIMFIACNFVENDKTWVGSLLQDEAENNLLKHQKVFQSLSYIFENECINLFSNVENPNDVIRVKDGDYPILLKKYMRNDIHLETVCLLSEILNFIPTWDKNISDTIVWPTYRNKITKFTSFMVHDVVKYKLILKKVLNKWSLKYILIWMVS